MGRTAAGAGGGSAAAVVTPGKNNQRRPAASLSATKREIKLTSPPAKTCSPGPLAPATNCSTAACQSCLKACEPSRRGWFQHHHHSLDSTRAEGRGEEARRPQPLAKTLAQQRLGLRLGVSRYGQGTSQCPQVPFLGFAHSQSVVGCSLSP